MMITGGGVINWTMLQAGLIDEISLVVTPTISGERNKATIFDRSDYSASSGGVSLELIETKVMVGGALHLRYRPKNKA